MKNTICIILILSLFRIGQAQEKVNIDIEKSSIKWFGEYTFYFGGHEGYINFSKGELTIKKDSIISGTFEVDMNSISNTDIEVKDANKSLVDHLKSEDFINVKDYPKAKLTISKIEYSDNKNIQVEADLIIKNIKNVIKFRAELDKNKREVYAKFRIDRTNWDINYNNILKNEAISDAIGLEIKLFY